MDNVCDYCNTWVDDGEESYPVFVCEYCRDELKGGVND